MYFLCTLKNRLFTRGFLVNSLPKAGTNLLAKAVALFPGIRRTEGVHQIFAPALNDSEENGKTIPYGIDSPRKIPLKKMENVFKQIKNGSFGIVHLPYSETVNTILLKRRIRTVLILRDPRDVVVSHARYVAKSPDHFLYNHYHALSDSERIMRSIQGVIFQDPDHPVLLNIYDRYHHLLDWMDSPTNYTTFFEKLVGPNGGGSRESQLIELRNIGEHLELSYDRGTIEKVADLLFGGTGTFHRGLIGSWRHHFSKVHESAFNQIAGSLLKKFDFNGCPQIKKSSSFTRGKYFPHGE